jgi:hypothetical protein
MAHSTFRHVTRKILKRPVPLANEALVVSGGFMVLPDSAWVALLESLVAV